jgi:hypothetical protein
MGRSGPVDPALASLNPAGYRKRIAQLHANERKQHLRSLSHEQMCQHLRAMLTKDGLIPRGEVDVRITFRGGAFDVLIRFGHPKQSSSFVYSEEFPPSVHGALIDALRELAREARMVRPTFTIKFHNEPFSMVPVEGFLDISRQLVASQLVPRRFHLRYSSEHHERGTVEPAYVTLFAHLTTDQREAVSVELCSTTHWGYEERLGLWVRQRAAEWAVPFENPGPWLRKA